MDIIRMMRPAYMFQAPWQFAFVRSDSSNAKGKHEAPIGCNATSLSFALQLNDRVDESKLSAKNAGVKFSSGFC